jgi:hypothetical protein
MTTTKTRIDKLAVQAQAHAEKKMRASPQWAPWQPEARAAYDRAANTICDLCLSEGGWADDLFNLVGAMLGRRFRSAYYPLPGDHVRTSYPWDKIRALEVLARFLELIPLELRLAALRTIDPVKPYLCVLDLWMWDVARLTRKLPEGLTQETMGKVVTVLIEHQHELNIYRTYCERCGLLLPTVGQKYNGSIVVPDDWYSSKYVKTPGYCALQPCPHCCPESEG